MNTAYLLLQGVFPQLSATDQNRVILHTRVIIPINPSQMTTIFEYIQASI